jgi:multidrug efflux pump subunit AcrA (membrane-fusion protein)
MDDSKAAKKAEQEKKHRDLLHQIELRKESKAKEKVRRQEIKALPAEERKAAERQLRLETQEERLKQLLDSDPVFAKKIAEDQAKFDATKAALEAKREASDAAREAKLKEMAERSARIKRESQDRKAEADEAKRASRELREANSQKIREEMQQKSEEKERLRKEKEVTRRIEREAQAKRDAVEKEERAAASVENEKLKQAEREKRKMELLAKYKPDEETLAARAKMIGNPVLSTLFGLTLVTIFENGYVRIGSGFDALPDKLISIQGHADITKKTAVGRTVAGLGLIAIGSLPLNIYAPSRRGDLTLTIVTDRETKVLHVGYASDIALEALRKLDAVGNAIISGNQNKGASQNTRVTDESLSAEILKLNQLYEAGILTQTEFTAAKSKLLG